MGVLLVTGGSGTLGRPLVARLRQDGHDVRVLSRRASGGTHVGDLRTGDGVAAAASGTDVVVHAASDTHRLGRSDLEQTRTLIRAIPAVRHLIYVSIVGIDAIPLGYYRRKLACEEAIEAADVPFTIVRATQFHELVATVLRGATHLPVAPLPLDFRFQSAAAADVAARLAAAVVDDPVGGVVQFGGPEVLTLAEMVRAWRAAHRGRPRVRRLPLPGRVADGFRAGRNTCPSEARGAVRWAGYVAQVAP